MKFEKNEIESITLLILVLAPRSFHLDLPSGFSAGFGGPSDPKHLFNSLAAHVLLDERGDWPDHPPALGLC